jgi:deoxyribonuclease IV
MNDTNIKYIGHNLNISNGFLSVVDYANTLEVNFIQIFLSNPQKYGGNRKPENDLKQLNQKLINNNIKMVIHASYKLNFCNPEESYIHKAAIKDLVNDLNDSVKIGAIGVVIHMGKNVKNIQLTTKEAITNYVKGIKTTLSKSDKKSTIILETGAGVGTEVCTDIFTLSKLYNMFTDNEKKRLKFCIDTCHIFAYGYHIGDIDFVDVFCDLIDKYLQWNNIACIH